MSPRIRQHKAPFPYFGGKAAIADEVWARIGDVGRYVEPFAGSLAVLLNRPVPFTGREIVNDTDGLLVNTWRAMAHDPKSVAEWADWPATENDLHARHAWLVGQRDDITRKLEGDPNWFDARSAGWWLWGIGLWIGGGWCSGRGPWHVVDVNDGRGVHRQLLHAGDDGQGVHRKLLHAVNDGRGVHRKLLHAGDDGQGVKRESPLAKHLKPRGIASASRRDNLEAVFAAIAERMRDVLVMCGDWSRVVTPAVTGGGGTKKPVGIFLDPPYSLDEREGGLYAHDNDVADEVRKWAIANGGNPSLRIALCGYAGEHAMPDSWFELPWKSHGGMAADGRAKANSRRERVWFSPHCVRTGLWEAAS